MWLCFQELCNLLPADFSIQRDLIKSTAWRSSTRCRVFLPCAGSFQNGRGSPRRVSFIAVPAAQVTWGQPSWEGPCWPCCLPEHRRQMLFFFFLSMWETISDFLSWHFASHETKVVKGRLLSFEFVLPTSRGRTARAGANHRASVRFQKPFSESFKRVLRRAAVSDVRCIMIRGNFDSLTVTETDTPARFLAMKTPKEFILLFFSETT